MVSILHVELQFRNVNIISSGKYKSTPFEFLYNSYGVQSPLNLSWVERNKLASLDSEI